VHTYTDIPGRATTTTAVEHYLFINLRSKTFYEYANFSDTARILNKYSQPDSAELPGAGGWRFYAQRPIKLAETPQKLTDTQVNHIIYQRYKLTRAEITSPRSFLIAYLRCDMKHTMFRFYKDLSDQLGCPIVRIEILPSRENPTPTSTHLEFVANQLTPSEIGIFDAWVKNEKHLE
jgi:hypothetical protein